MAIFSMRSQSFFVSTTSLAIPICESRSGYVRHRCGGGKAGPRLFAEGSFHEGGCRCRGWKYEDSQRMTWFKSWCFGEASGKLPQEHSAYLIVHRRHVFCLTQVSPIAPFNHKNLTQNCGHVCQERVEKTTSYSEGICYHGRGSAQMLQPSLTLSGVGYWLTNLLRSRYVSTS